MTRTLASVIGRALMLIRQATAAAAGLALLGSLLVAGISVGAQAAPLETPTPSSNPTTTAEEPAEHSEEPAGDAVDDGDDPAGETATPDEMM